MDHWIVYTISIYSIYVTQYLNPEFTPINRPWYRSITSPSLTMTPAAKVLTCSLGSSLLTAGVRSKTSPAHSRSSMTCDASSVTSLSSPVEPDATFRSTIVRKRARRADRIVGSSEAGRVWSERRKVNASSVTVGRYGVWGPMVERVRVSVWMNNVRRLGVMKGLYEGAVDLYRC